MLSQPLLQKSAPSLQYLYLFDETEITALEDKYHKTREELDEVVEKYWKSLWYYRTENWIANATNLLYMPFQINTSNEGIQSFVQAIVPSAEVPNAISYGIGAPLAIIEGSVYIFAFSAVKQAIRSTLDYALRDSLCHRTWNLLKNPLQLLFFLVNQSILCTNNLTGSMSDIIDIHDQLEELPTGLYIATIATILYFANRYMMHYMNDDYMHGLQFWKNDKNRPWLLGEMRRGNFAVPLQILLQGACGIALKTFPSYYYLAVTSEKLLGWWLPAPITAALITLHSACAIYPVTYNYYMDREESVRKDQRIPRSQKEKAIIEKEGRCYLWKHAKPSIFLTAFRGIAGAGFGAQLGLTLTDNAMEPVPLIVPISFAITGAGLLGMHCYLAEANRVMPELIEKEHEEKEIAPRQSLCAKFTQVLTSGIMIVAGSSVATSIIGMGARIGTGIPWLNSLIAIAAVDKAISAILYNGDKVLKTTGALCAKQKTLSSPSVSTTHGTFFKPSIQDEEKIENEELASSLRQRTPSPDIV